jgi:hypothetical protein
LWEHIKKVGREEIFIAKSDALSLKNKKLANSKICKLFLLLFTVKIQIFTIIMAVLFPKYE